MLRLIMGAITRDLPPTASKDHILHSNNTRNSRINGPTVPNTSLLLDNINRPLVNLDHSARLLVSTPSTLIQISPLPTDPAVVAAEYSENWEAKTLWILPHSSSAALLLEITLTRCSHQ
jgi:hypothetical protein